MKNKEVRKIVLNLDFRVLFKELSFENAGRMLFEVMDKYAEQKELSLEDPTTLAYAKVWCADVDIALKYSRIKSEINSANGKKGGEQKAKNLRKREAELKQQPELFKEEAASEGDDVPLVEAEEVEPYPFEFFWREYISHKDEQNARRIWKCLPNDLREKAINGAKIYTQYVLARKSKDPNFDAILKPSSFLKDAHWNDEYKEEELTPQNNGNNNKQYNNRLVQQQRNNEVLRNIMAEAAAAVRPRNPIETTGAGSL